MPLSDLINIVQTANTAPHYQMCGTYAPRTNSKQHTCRSFHEPFTWRTSSFKATAISGKFGLSSGCSCQHILSNATQLGGRPAAIFGRNARRLTPAITAIASMSANGCCEAKSAFLRGREHSRFEPNRV